MDSVLLAVVTANTVWYALPLVVAVSLVYAATRHEQMKPILAHAWRVGVWISVFMGIVLAVLLVVSWLMKG
jgi:hypothetical protein